MAFVIPNDFFLPPGRFLILQDETGSPLGTVVRLPASGYTSMSTKLDLKGSKPNPAYPGPPEAPEPPTIAVEFERVVFQIEGSQEVKIDGVDHFIVHEDQILAFIPPAE